jgi:predicted DCC family thiol-disulfide oxidoreductase YuxK
MEQGRCKSVGEDSRERATEDSNVVLRVVSRVGRRGWRGLRFFLGLGVPVK